jgi:hypothetical protein
VTGPGPIDVGEHECVTCPRCATTYAKVHPACPRCSSAARAVAAETALAEAKRERDEWKNAQWAAAEDAVAAERRANALADALRAIAGNAPDGSEGFHFVGDEHQPGECPGCIARAALDRHTHQEPS